MDTSAIKGAGMGRLDANPNTNAGANGDVGTGMGVGVGIGVGTPIGASVYAVTACWIRAQK